MSALWATAPSVTATGIESYAAGLYERHNAAIFRHCLKQLRRREDADDAVQTTFVYALLSLRRGVVPRTELPWLFTIAGNVCSSRRRTRARRGPLEAAQDLDALQDVIPTPERGAAVSAADFRSALSAMPDAQRSALLLREWRGLSYNEIADELGLSQSATETLLFRARRSLARKLEEKAGLGTINGVSLASLIRSLLQSGAGKTFAVALGAAAIASTPASQHHSSDVAARVPIVSPGAVKGDADLARPSLHLPGRPDAGRHQSARPLDGTADPSEGPMIAGVEGDAASAGPVVHDGPRPAMPQPAAPAEKTPPTPLEEAGAIATAASSAIAASGVPPAPPISDALPPIPDVQLPSVTVPPTPGLPIG